MVPAVTAAGLVISTVTIYRLDQYTLSLFLLYRLVVSTATYSVWLFVNKSSA